MSDFDISMFRIFQEANDTVSPMERLDRRLSELEASHATNVAELHHLLDTSVERINHALEQLEQRISAVESHYEAWLAYMEADEGYTTKQSKNPCFKPND